jgi:hypothetical protein
MKTIAPPKADINFGITMRMKAIGRLISTNNLVESNLRPEGLSLFCSIGISRSGKSKGLLSVTSVSLW